MQKVRTNQKVFRVSRLTKKKIKKFIILCPVHRGVPNRFLYGPVPIIQSFYL